MTKVLITGGAGFFGINLAEKLLEKANNVILYDVNTPPKEMLDKVQYIEGDIRDVEKLEKAIRGIDVVYNAAAMVPSAGDRTTFYEVNVKGAENVGRIALNHKVQKFIHVSSSSIYDPRATLPLTEKSPLRKKGGMYEMSKCHGDLTIQKLMKEGLPATIIRPRTIIGRHRGGSFHILFDWIREEKRVYIIGKGDNKFQMISASDLSNACITAAESNKSAGEVFNVGTDEYGTLKESIEKVIQHAGSKSKVTPLPANLAKITLRILYYTRISPVVPWHYNNMDRNFYYDTAKIKQVLGWKPKDSNQDMLIESYNWFVEHYDEFEIGHSHAQAPSGLKILNWLKKIS